VVDVACVTIFIDTRWRSAANGDLGGWPSVWTNDTIERIIDGKCNLDLRRFTSSGLTILGDKVEAMVKELAGG